MPLSLPAKDPGLGTNTATKCPGGIVGTGEGVGVAVVTHTAVRVVLPLIVNGVATTWLPCIHPAKIKPERVGVGKLLICVP